jgi:hypothetical protein
MQKPEGCLRSAGVLATVFGQFSVQAILAVVLLVGVFSDAHSATETWNPGGAGGGNGTWDTGVTPDWDSGVT